MGAERDQLLAASQAWEDAFNAGDASGVAAVYSADAKLLPPDEHPVHGTEAITSYWAGFIEATGEFGGLDREDVIVDGDLGVITGAVEAEVGGEQMRVKYIEVWRHGDDGWRMHRDIWNATP